MLKPALIKMRKIGGYFTDRGKMARCSSYQKPGRGRGEKIKAGTTVVNCGTLLYEVAFFNCSFI